MRVVVAEPGLVLVPAHPTDSALVRYFPNRRLHRNYQILSLSLLDLSNRRHSSRPKVMVVDVLSALLLKAR